MSLLKRIADYLFNRYAVDRENAILRDEVAELTDQLCDSLDEGTTWYTAARKLSERVTGLTGDLETARARETKLLGDLETAKAKLLPYQRTVTELLEDKYTPKQWHRVPKGQRVYEYLEYNEPDFKVAMTEPVCSTIQSFDMHEIRIGFSLGLSEATPPEVVAGKLSRDLENLVLSLWSSQSVLNR